MQARRQDYSSEPLLRGVFVTGVDAASLFRLIVGCHSFPEPATPDYRATSRKRPISLIVKEAIDPIPSDVDVVEAVIVVVTDTRSLTPSCGDQTGLRCDAGESSVVIFMKGNWW